MGCGIVTALLVLACVATFVDSVTLDLDVTRQLEEVIKKDDFILSLKHIKPRKRTRSAVETLFAVDFPGAEHKLVLLLDRKTKKVLVETLEDGRKRSQHFTVDTLHDESIIKSLILAVNQTQPGAHATLYIDCVSYGMVATPKSMRDMFSSMRDPRIEVFHERKYPLEVDGHRNLRMVLSRNGCPLPPEIENGHKIDDFFKSDIFSNELKDDPNFQAIEPEITTRRGDIPLLGPVDDPVIETLNRLIKAVNLETQRCEETTSALNELRRIITECELCRRNREVPTCSTHPPRCFPGVQCHDTQSGPTCGHCPPRYTGNGYECTPEAPPVTTCAENPCFDGVQCRDTAHGARCDPCPPGFQGDGVSCRRINYCDYNPCAPGVRCVPIEESPFYRCAGCPAGYEGNGTNCHPIDECDLRKPCDSRVDCINLRPGYRCMPCPAGFNTVADEATRRHMCVDIDECADRNICGPHSQCINTEGSYHCSRCGYGYVADPAVGCRPAEGYCQNGEQCDRNAQCVDWGWGRHKCQCAIGYAGNGQVCGPDRDQDSWPDVRLPCDDAHCNQDNCPYTPNSGQEDTDGDGQGDACDSDADGDGVHDDDNCPLNPNPDQADSEREGGDKVGDICDNCRYVKNPDQSDIDKDGIGDACDDDMDNDGILNHDDNCPKVANRDQYDRDGDRIGDACDNCPDEYNPYQEDYNENLVGDACDSPLDTDRDGVADIRDNCRLDPNPDQLDTDRDGKGDACDNDKDGDGVPNERDNCPFVPNPDQTDKDGDGIGEACDPYDIDNDKVNNTVDTCPNNSLIFQTDFSKYQTVILDPVGESQIDPNWEIYNNGAEILQTMNSDPGLAVGHDKLYGVDFEGTFFVDTEIDDDYIGFIFSYHSNRRFYAVMWKKNAQTYWLSTPFRAYAEPGIQIKVVDSQTGPGEILRNSLWHTGNTTGQVKTLWIDPKNAGWREKTSYRWFLMHRPSIGLIRLKIFEGERMITDSGNIFDTTLKGGRLGVFCFSQEMIIWSDLVYRCNEFLREDVWKELPPRLQRRIRIDNTRSYTVASPKL